tara:strand:- start:247 stop:468 length:222 start_codon:yes stop_codon:yes gene_type:complete
MTEVKQGTLLIDRGMVGIVIKIYKIGATSMDDKATQQIHWEESYHIYYSDGTHSYINRSAFDILVITGDIKIL